MKLDLTPLKHWQTLFDVSKALTHGAILALAAYGLYSLGAG